MRAGPSHTTTPDPQRSGAVVTQKNRSNLSPGWPDSSGPNSAPQPFTHHHTRSTLLPPKENQQYLSDQTRSRPNGQCSTFRSIIALERMSRKRRVDTRHLHDLASMLLRKEVIQPHLPVRLPCYDFVLIASPTFDGSLHKG